MNYSLLKQAAIKFFLALTLVGSTFASPLNAQDNKQIALIPYPAELQLGSGNFLITASTGIILENKVFTNEAAQLNALFSQYLGKPLKLSTASKNAVVSKSSIRLKLDNQITAPEAYKLEVTTKEVVLKAKDPAGMFRAVQTIRQLLPANEGTTGYVKTLNLPVVNIADQPAFEWRGMHLDVSRHFFSLDYLRKFIDLLALYKFNKFHLHLTDDQGWRIEIKKYPKLTEEGAWRSFNNQDSLCMERSKENPDFIIDPKHIVKKNGKVQYGGFYTQAEMKALVAYATARHVTIIPEIDMPGHMMAAINSYPFLSGTAENKWGKLFTTPISPCSDEVFQFAENIFAEIMDIFPSQYIHVGGDEVDRSSWEKSPMCKTFMDRHGLKTAAELQSYFINHMEKYFNSKGRKLIGWDEILEDGISSTAMVMYWRSWVPDAPVKAAKNGNKVIMSPGNPLYFDSDPDQNSVYNVYHFNPVPKGLTAAEGKGIIGAQANTWAEKIPSENRADYMIYPRMTALAERLWTNKDLYESYSDRLTAHFPRLEALKVNYRLPDIQGLVEKNVFTDVTELNPKKPLRDLILRYTTDGSKPTEQSAELTKALVIKDNLNVQLAAFTRTGIRGDIYKMAYSKQPLAPAARVANAQPGLQCAYYPGAYKSSTLMNGKPAAVYTANTVAVPKEANAASFGVKFSGYLNIPQDGVYSFYLTCDDGGILKVGPIETVNNDGWHAPIEKSGQAALKKGLQPIALDFVEGGGGYTLKLKYSLNGSAPVEVPSSWLMHL
jgi:hexosaminidase